MRQYLRLACKPHSVRQSDSGLHPWASSRPSCLGGHLSERPTRDSNEASSLSSLCGLAPGGGYLAARIAADAGGLLHRLFTLALAGSLFLWPDPAGFPAPGFPRRRALWSADFPRPRAEARDRDRPASLRRFHHTCSYCERQPSAAGQLGYNQEGRLTCSNHFYT